MRWNPKAGLAVMALALATLVAACDSSSDSKDSTTPSTPKAAWSFAVLCDSRSSYASDPAGTSSPYYAANGTSPYFSNIAKALAREPGIDFVLYPGDLVRGKKPTMTGVDFAADLDAWMAAMEPVYAATIPVYYVRGNHDAYEVSDAVTVGTTATQIFGAHVAQPGQGPNPASHDPIVFDTTAGSLTSYAFSHKGSLFVGIDEYVNGAASTAAYDAAFVTSQIARSAEHKFVFGHQPLWNYKSDELGPTGLADVLEAGHTSLYFSGHVHSYQRIAEAGYGFQQVIVGTGGAPQDDPTLVNGGPGGNTYALDDHLSVRASAGGVNANARFGYLVVTVHPDGTLTSVLKVLDNPTSAASTVSSFDAADVSPR
jgi:hypothetical protein